MRLPPFNPRLAVGVGIIAISTTSILVKLLGTIPASIIASYRLFFALIILWPITFLYRQNELKNIRKNDWFKLAFAGVLYAVYLGLWFHALQFLSVTSAVLILSLQPVFLLIASMLFLKERYSTGAWISILITLVGGSLIVWGDYKFLDRGVYSSFILFIGLIVITTYQITIQRVKRSLSFVTYLTILYTIAFVILIPYNLFQAHSYLDFTLNEWGYLLLLGIVPTFLGFGLFNWALRWLRAQTVSASLVLEPMIAATLAYYFLHEIIAPYQWLGGAVIVFGLLLFIMSTKRKTEVTISKQVTRKKRK